MIARTSPRVLVTHPGRQHSHQAAVALEKAGMLAGYWAGAPSLDRHARALPTPLRGRLPRYDPVDLPADRVAWYPAIPVLRRLGGALLPRRLADRVDFLACRLFDRRGAARLERFAADAVIGCEISALSIFRTAKSRGIVTLLDAPSFHHQAQDRLHGFTEPEPLHRRITAVKDREIELADHVLTVSELARETYVVAGVDPARVHAEPLGADLELFHPGAGEPPPPEGPLRLAFAGATLRRKGFDLLLAALRRAREAEAAVTLTVVGPAGDQHRLLEDARDLPIEWSPRVSQAELARIFRSHHLLVLPSRNDSYGMVVAEALGCGLPVLVSTMVGSKDLVTPGQNGWVVPLEGAEALAERLVWASRNVSGLLAMREAAVESARQATWESYHQRFSALVRRLLEAKVPT